MRPLLKTLGYARHLWPYYTGIVLLSILSAAAGLAGPFIIKEATDLVVDVAQGAEANIGRALLLAALMFAFDIGGSIIRNVGGYLGDVMAVKLRTELSVRYYEHLLRLPQSYYDEELTGTIINKLNRAITEVTQFLNSFANSFFQMILTAISTIAIVAFYSWELALIVLLIYPTFGWLTTKTSKRWQKLQHEKNQELDIASGRFAEVVSQVRVVKSYASERIELKHFKDRFLRTIDINAVQSRFWHKMDVLRGGVLSLLFFGIAAFLFIGTVDGRFTPGEMILLITLINTIRMPIFSMSYIVDNYQRAVTGSYEFASVMEIEPVISDQPGASSIKIEKGEVVFDDVSFAYTKGQLVLKGISFVVKPGEKLALVGESGEGKTTISNLLMRLYEPSKGAIKIDGVDISKVKQASLRANIATVFQDPALFSGTIRENIAYGRPSATKKDIVRAAKAANADEFISKLKDGYDSVVGERGIKLSGGQKQRISIARALLKDAPILILDEATSSLDSRSEHMVQAALERLMKGRTTLIIAHRLSTIAHVDTIVTLKNGRVHEIGAPRELAKTDGIYAELLKLQSGGDEKSKEKLKEFEMGV